MRITAVDCETCWRMQSAVSHLNLDPTGGGSWAGFLFVGNCNLTSLDVHVRTGVKLQSLEQKQAHTWERRGGLLNLMCRGLHQNISSLKSKDYPIKIFLSRVFTKKISCLVVHKIFYQKLLNFFDKINIFKLCLKWIK